MTFSGHDPSGGAGIQADIETLASQGCHATPVLTAITTQDTRDVVDYTVLDSTHVITQARAILEDMPVSAFKIGMLGATGTVEAVHSILRDYPEVPVVLDPVLATEGGTSLAATGLLDAIKVLLLPQTTIITPNSQEVRALVPEADTLDACGSALLDLGVEYALITGTHENTTQVINTLFHGHQKPVPFTWERLPHRYHGSGCTLAACLAGLIAHGVNPLQAAHEAQTFTWHALQQGYRPGMGQYLPERLFWAKQKE